MRYYSFYSVLFCALSITAQAATQQDLSWPRHIQADNVKFTMYQPQLEQMEHNLLQLNMAFSASNSKDTAHPYLGALNAQCTLVSHDKQIAECKNIKINTIQLPASPEADKMVRSALNKAVANSTLTLSYDQLQAGLRVAKISERPHNTNFSFTPPKIFVANQPTALITIDGAPVMRAVKDTTLMRVINTPFVILFDAKNSTYYLRAGSSWHTTNDLKGKWQLANTVPADVTKVQSQLKDPNQGESGINDFVVSTTPASLIEINGEANFVSIPGTDLMYVQNTDSKIIMDSKSQRYFALISGRWFSTNALTNSAQWTYVPGNELPASFKKIPADLPISDVLASVPGTQQAEEAVIRNQIPEIKKFEKKSLKLQVKYDGKPRLEQIKGTSLQAVRNANKPVIQYQNRYYANDNSVWFVADSPDGPWGIADAIPNDFYNIPPDSPYYPLTYCYIYDSTGDYVTVGCTPGYGGSYVYNGAVIYGTGYYYDPWIGDEYYGWPFTYGFDYGYDPYYGWYSPVPYYWFGGFALGSWAGYSYWHHYHHGFYGHRGFWNNRHAFHERNRLEQNAIHRHHAQALSHAHTHAQTHAMTHAQTHGMTHAQTHGHRQNAHHQLYSSQHGHVYRHQGGTHWERHTHGGWQREHNQQTIHHLSRHEQARFRSEGLTRERFDRAMMVPHSAPSSFGGHAGFGGFPGGGGGHGGFGGFSGGGGGHGGFSGGGGHGGFGGGGHGGFGGGGGGGHGGFGGGGGGGGGHGGFGGGGHHH